MLVRPPKSLHHAIHLALSGALLATPLAAGLTALPAWAQNVEAEYTFNIATGSLEAAIVEFSATAGITLSFEPSVVRDRQSPGLQGRYEASEALQRLLQGSGLQAVPQAGGSYSLQPLATQGNALQLDATTVTGNLLGATTEGSGSYTTGSMQTATKLPLTLRETPQSATVITRQRMDDQAMRSLDDVVQAAPGLKMSMSRPANNEFFSRGFPVTNLMFDGLPTTYNGDWVASADLAPYDRVEIVRGATGMMQGAGNPSAAINMVRKRPTTEFRGSISGTAGSWDNYRSELDLSGPLTDSGAVRGRFVGAYHDKDSYQDYAGRERGVFYGITEFDLSEATTLTLGASHQNDNNGINWGGLPVNPDGSHTGLSRSKTLGYDWSHQDIDNTTVFTEIDHRFENDWRLHLGASKNWSDFALTGAVIENYGTYRQRVFNQKRDYDQSTYDVYANGPFQMFERQHELVVGASKRELKTSAVGGTIFIPVADIINFDPSGLAKPTVPDSYRLSQHVEQKGAYVTTRLNITDALKTILGARLDWYEDLSITNQINDGYYTDSNYKVTRNVTHYAGVIYDLDDRHSVYASYTDVFMPQSETGRDRQIIKPIEGKNYEIGIKGEYFSGALNASAAIFQIDQENRAAELDDQTGCIDFTCYGASGKVRTQGIDLELNGAVTSNWQLGAGYTFSQTKYRQDANKDREGTLFDTNLPRHMFKLNTVYMLPGEFKRWRVGANIYSQSSIFNKGSNSTFGDFHVEQGSYAIVGLMAGYEVSKNLDTRLNINNVFDKKYYQGIAGNPTWSPYDIYGEPRNFTLTAKYSF